MLIAGGRFAPHNQRIKPTPGEKLWLSRPCGVLAAPLSTKIVVGVISTIEDKL